MSQLVLSILNLDYTHHAIYNKISYSHTSRFAWPSVKGSGYALWGVMHHSIILLKQRPLKINVSKVPLNLAVLGTIAPRSLSGPQLIFEAHQGPNAPTQARSRPAVGGYSM